MSNPRNANIFTKNAVLFKDMSIDIKRPKILILMMIFNAIIMMVAAGFLFGLSAANLGGEAISYRILAIMLIVMISVEASILFVVTPALTASCISGERERQTLDVLLTTRMSPFEIVMGKYLSALMQGALLVLSTLPFLALVFIYGGLNFLQLIGLMAVTIYEVAFIATFGVFFSALTKRTVFAVILSYVILGMLVGGTFAVFGSVYWVVELINERVHSTYGALSSGATLGQFLPEFHADWAIFFLLINPVVTIFDCIGSFLGVEIEDVVFNGMRTIVDMNYLTGDNPLIIAWTPLSLIVQGAIGYGLLRLSGACLNPVKNTKKREREYERRHMKKVGVQPDVVIPGSEMPLQDMVPGEQGQQPVQTDASQSVETGSQSAEQAVQQSAEQTMQQPVEQVVQQPVEPAMQNSTESIQSAEQQ